MELISVFRSGNEFFTAYKINIQKRITVAYEYDDKMDLTPKPVEGNNWFIEYMKALYRDRKSPYYQVNQERLDDLDEAHVITPGNIIVVLDTYNHFLGKINFDHDEKHDIMRVMYLYVCGNRRDMFFENNIKSYQRGPFIVWYFIVLYCHLKHSYNTRILITYPRYHILKYLKQCDAVFVELDNDGYVDLIKSLPIDDKCILDLNRVFNDNENDTIENIGAFLKTENIIKIILP